MSISAVFSIPPLTISKGQTDHVPYSSIQTLQVVNFAKQVCDFPDTVESFLQTLGDGNWLPGAAPGAKRGGGNLSADGGEFALLSKYLGRSYKAH